MEKYLLNVPENKTGSCGMIVIRDRKSFKLMVDVSMSSIMIFPSIWAKRKRAPTRELFPAPVRPTIPKFKFTH